MSKELIFLMSLFLSIVLIWFSKTVESLSSFESFFERKTFVGYSSFILLDVIGAIIVVGLYLLPRLFWIIKTGLIPLCSEPTAGSKFAITISPLITRSIFRSYPI